MAYGKISDEQWEVIRPHVSGLVVHDIGAGSCEHSLKLLALGATKVVAIDKEEMPRLDRRIKRVTTHFQLYISPIDVAFVCWPINGEQPGLVAIVRRSRLVIYIGKNTDGLMCASPDFFLEMSNREVTHYLPERRNTLIVYGARLDQPRKRLRGEERAGVEAYKGDAWMTFEQAERAEKPSGARRK